MTTLKAAAEKLCKFGAIMHFDTAPQDGTPPGDAKLLEAFGRLVAESKSAKIDMHDPIVVWDSALYNAYYALRNIDCLQTVAVAAAAKCKESAHAANNQMLTDIQALLGTFSTMPLKEIAPELALWMPLVCRDANGDTALHRRMCVFFRDVANATELPDVEICLASSSVFNKIYGDWFKEIHTILSKQVRSDAAC